MFAGTVRDQALRARAYTLAESGRFATVRDVEQAIIGEGWPDAARVLGSSYVRQALTERLAAKAA